MLTFEYFLQQLVTGLANGMLITLVAIGYTLVYGIVEMINFAHGDVFMLGAFSSVTTLQALGAQAVKRVANKDQPPIPETYLWLVIALITSMVFCATLNVLIERLAYRRLRRGSRMAPLISAIGVSFILQNVGIYWKGVSPVNFPRYIPQIDLVKAFGIDSFVRVTTKDVFVFVVTVPLVIALPLFIQRTKLGKAMRATAQDRDAAQLMGIDINRTIALTFLLGGALAGAAGLVSGLYNNTAGFQMGFSYGLNSFTAAVLGGIGNLNGAMLGGVFIGILAAMSDGYLDARWTPIVIFGTLNLVLIIRPSGILGQDLAERA